MTDHDPDPVQRAIMDVYARRDLTMDQARALVREIQDRARADRAAAAAEQVERLLHDRYVLPSQRGTPRGQGLPHASGKDE